MTTRPNLVGPNLDDAGEDLEMASAAEVLAGELLDEAVARRGSQERRRARLVGKMLADDEAREFALALTDEVMRVRDDRRAAELLGRLTSGSRADRFLGPVDRLLLRLGVVFAGRFPSLVMPLVRARVRSALAPFVVDASPRALGRHLARRRQQGVRANLNILGEAVLGDTEAGARAQSVSELLARPDVDYVSVKVSSVCAQLNLLAFESEVERVSRHLRPIYEQALASEPPKMVNLDMEQYRDLDLTVAAFRKVMSEPRFERLTAGIVLQAYIPESLAALEELVGWALDRHRQTGAAVKIRVVKGANLAMENVEAEISGWSPAPMPNKAEVDAHYKRLIDRALRPENSGALRVGAASHNVFELAWALTVASRRGLAEMLDLEMLEGMAPSLAEAVLRRTGDLLLYTPIAERRDAESSIAYLVRRFDENTGPDNFLRHQFSMRRGDAEWDSEVQRFRRSVAEHRRPARPTRRGAIEATTSERPPPLRIQPDTDLAVAANRIWSDGCFRGLDELDIDVVPAVVAGREVRGLRLVDGVDPSTGAVVYRWSDTSEELIDEAVAAAATAGAHWRDSSPADRREVLSKVAHALESRRAELIATMGRDAGKIFPEADPEVSEAVDFARFYATYVRSDSEAAPGFRHYRTVAVVPPWNFPLAIPAGGVLAALAAGAAVLLKPAPESVATAWLLARACWHAGVPRDLLQFVPCIDGTASKRLVCHEGVDAVVLTGSWETARMFHDWRPKLRLHGETSGKNAILITASADLEQTVVDLVRSAFGHSGQKCSAASLAIVEDSVYEDPRFRRQLEDTVKSLRPGPSWDRRTTIGPLIRPPAGPLLDALTHLQAGEEWLVRPGRDIDNARLWTPGVKLGVQQGSSFHMTECFGPVLGVMRSSGLDEAIEWQNQVPYGLTAGLAALDPYEISYWREKVKAGNLYVNRHTTGAIVGRQPFGGWKRSVVGPGVKTGGPNYVASLGAWSPRRPSDIPSFVRAVSRARNEGLTPSDPAGLDAESNVLRYRPLERVLLRIGSDTDDWEAAATAAAARALGVSLEISASEQVTLTEPVTVESEAQLAERLDRTEVDKLRLLGEVGDRVRSAGIDAGLWLDEGSPAGDERAEALRWVREQCVTETRHRHGDVTSRRPGLRVTGPARPPIR